MSDIQISEDKLRHLAKVARHHNVAPIFMPRYLDEDHPVGRLLTPLVDEAAELLATQTVDEVQAVLDRLPPGLRMFVDQTHHRAEFLRRLATYYVVARVHRQYLSFSDVINARPGSSEILQMYPELAADLDEDGLLRVTKELTLYDDGIGYKDHVLHYHQFLRRGFTANPNFDFLSRFIRCYRRSHINSEFRIAIDHTRIMDKRFYEHLVEFDTWYGPLFDEQRLDDPSAIGPTVIKRNKDSLFELTNRLDRTEFFWARRNGIKAFEVEEVSDTNYAFDQYIINRYAHSERDITQRLFRHLDGAAKIYLRDNYSPRFESTLPREPRA